MSEQRIEGCEGGFALDSRIDSFSASRMVSTSCSSTKSSKLRCSSFLGLNTASTMVDRNISIVDSSLVFAASRVLITFCDDSQPADLPPRP